MRDPTGRLYFRYSLVRNCPGPYGFRLRVKALRENFGSCGEGVRIHEGARFRNVHKIRLGANVTVGVDNFIQAAGGVTIGDDTLLGPGVKIWSTNHVFADPDRPIRDQGAEYKEVVIGRDCWIGTDSFIMPGTVLGDGCVVSAMSVVGAKKYPPYSILMGNPARVIGNRKKSPDGGD
jgi:maltose O-acetyltransferase